MGPWVISFPSLLLANLYWYFQKRGSPLLPDAASLQQFLAHQRKGFISVIWQRFLTHCKQFGFLSFGNNLLPNEKKRFNFFAFGKVFMLGPHQCWALQLLTSFLLIKNRFGLCWYMCWLVYFHLHPIGNLQIFQRFFVCLIFVHLADAFKGLPPLCTIALHYIILFQLHCYPAMIIWPSPTTSSLCCILLCPMSTTSLCFLHHCCHWSFISL